MFNTIRDVQNFSAANPKVMIEIHNFDPKKKYTNIVRDSDKDFFFFNPRAMVIKTREETVDGRKYYIIETEVGKEV